MQPWQMDPTLRGHLQMVANLFLAVLRQAIFSYIPNNLDISAGVRY